MLRLLTCARDLSSLAVGHHSIFVVLSPKGICKARVLSVLYSKFSVFIHLQCRIGPGSRNDEKLEQAEGFHAALLDDEKIKSIDLKVVMTPKA